MLYYLKYLFTSDFVSFILPQDKGTTLLATTAQYTFTFSTVKRFLRSQHAKSVCVLHSRLFGVGLISQSN